jgi:hypothetical protein
MQNKARTTEIAGEFGWFLELLTAGLGTKPGMSFPIESIG